MNPYRLGGALLAAATLLSTLLAGPAQATTHTNAHHSWSRLTLTVRSPHGIAHLARLECQPSGGTHPHADRACNDVAAAGGDFDNLPGAQTLMACTMEFRPVLVSAHGHWFGQPVHWRHQYPNPCVLVSEAGTVFDF